MEGLSRERQGNGWGHVVRRAGRKVLPSPFQTPPSALAKEPRPARLRWGWGVGSVLREPQTQLQKSVLTSVGLSVLFGRIWITAVSFLTGQLWGLREIGRVTGLGYWQVLGFTRARGPVPCDSGALSVHHKSPEALAYLCRALWFSKSQLSHQPWSLAAQSKAYLRGC